MKQIRINSLRPLFTGVVCSFEKYSEDVTDESGVVVIKAGVEKEYQVIEAIGGSVREVKVGDVVIVRPDRFYEYDGDGEPGGSFRQRINGRKVIGINWPVVMYGGREHLMINENDISCVVESYCEEEFEGLVSGGEVEFVGGVMGSDGCDLDNVLDVITSNSKR